MGPWDDLALKVRQAGEDVEEVDFQGAKPLAHESITESVLGAKLDDGKKVHYFDIGAKFLTADGTLEKSVMPDLLHLNAASYQVEADAIREKLASLVK